MLLLFVVCVVFFVCLFFGGQGRNPNFEVVLVWRSIAGVLTVFAKGKDASMMQSSLVIGSR